MTTLPAGIFDGLTALTELDLSFNGLTTLPDGIFDGLTALTTLHLSLNTVDPLPLTVFLEKVAEGQFKAVTPTGAPFTFVLPVSISNGSITRGRDNPHDSEGSVESDSLTVTRIPGITAAVTVNIGDTLPGLPSGHSGYELVKSADLPVEVISSSTVVISGAPTFTEGLSATRSVLENTQSGVDIGDPVSATDTNSNTLTYTLSGRNAASFDIVSTSGQLQTDASLNYETKNTYTVIITASDGNLTDTITVTINVIDVEEGTFTAVSERTPKVRDAIVAAAGVSSADDVTAAHLAAITRLYLYSDVTTLQVGDFDGLTNLIELDLFNNSGLTTLPAGIFDDLTNLTELSLNHNGLTTLPAGIFDDLTNLTEFEMKYNSALTTLPAGIFAGLTNLTRLSPALQ